MEAPYSAKMTAKRTTGRLSAEVCSVTIQGGLVTLRKKNLRDAKQPRAKRGEVTEFSKGSRYRLLTLIARTDWERLPHGMFITLTYPDEIADADPPTATMHKSHFVRYLEKSLKQRLPILWRKEAIDRKSGVYTGFHVSHFHLCVFTDGQVGPDRVNEWWRKSIGWKWEVQCHRRFMTDGEHAAFYLAKYLLKDPTQGILDNVTYLTNPGRAWGVLRKDLWPISPCELIANINPKLYAELLAIGRQIWGHELSHCVETMTLLGGKADEFVNIFRGKYP